MWYLGALGPACGCGAPIVVHWYTACGRLMCCVFSAPFACVQEKRSAEGCVIFAQSCLRAGGRGRALSLCYGACYQRVLGAICGCWVRSLRLRRLRSVPVAWRFEEGACYQCVWRWCGADCCYGCNAGDAIAGDSGEALLALLLRFRFVCEFICMLSTAWAPVSVLARPPR